MSPWGQIGHRCDFNHTFVTMTYRLQPLVWDSHKSDVIIGVSNHQPHLGLLNRLSRRRSKRTSKLRVTGLCEGKSSVAGELIQTTWDQYQYDEFITWKRFPHRWPFVRVSVFYKKMYYWVHWLWYHHDIGIQWTWLEIIIHGSVITTSLTNSHIHLCTAILIITDMSHERYGASNHRQLECFFKSLLGITSKNMSKLCILSPW